MRSPNSILGMSPEVQGRRFRQARFAARLVTAFGAVLVFWGAASCTVDVPAEQEGFPCEPDGSCAHGLTCVDDVCVVGEEGRQEGGPGQPCYPNDTCDADLICEEGVCVGSGPGDKGGLGQPCYPNDTCDADLICEEGVCVGSGPGDELEFETLAAQSINEDSAVLRGEIINLGSATSVDAYFEYRRKGGVADFDVLTQGQVAMVDYYYDNLTNSQYIFFNYTPPHPVSTAIADRVLTWQMDYNGRGGWAKNRDDLIYGRDWNGVESKSGNMTQNNTVPMSSLDNGATTTHMHYLAAVYGEHGGAAYKAAILKAMDMILYTGAEEVRHDYGEYNAWGQFYPPQTWSGSVHENQPTINDRAHYRNLTMFQKILNNRYPFDNDIFDSTYKAEIEDAYYKGIEWLIRVQLKKTTGERTLWAGDYDLATGLEPRWARGMEPSDQPDILTVDSHDLMLFLLSLPVADRTDEVKRMVFYGAKYMHDTALIGWEYRRLTSPYYFETGSPDDIMWYMFQQAEDGAGVWAEDYVRYYSIMEISEPLRYSYYWAIDRGYQFVNEYDEYVGLYGEPEVVLAPDEWTITATQEVSAAGIVTQSVTGLDAGTEYEFRMVVEAVVGEVLSLTTE